MFHIPSGDSYKEPDDMQGLPTSWPQGTDLRLVFLVNNNTLQSILRRKLLLVQNYTKCYAKSGKK